MGLGCDSDLIAAAINTRPDCPSSVRVCGLLMDFEMRIGAPSCSISSMAFNASSGNENSKRHTRTSRWSPTSGFSNDQSSWRGRSRSRRGQGCSHPSSNLVTQLHLHLCYRCGHPYHKGNNYCAQVPLIAWPPMHLMFLVRKFIVVQIMIENFYFMPQTSSIKLIKHTAFHDWIIDFSPTLEIHQGKWRLVQYGEIIVCCKRLERIFS